MPATPTTAQAIPENLEKGSSLTRDAWHRLRKNQLAMASLWLVAAMFLLCFLGPFVPLVAEPNQTHPELKSLGPFSEAVSREGAGLFYLLGSDNLGRDIFARILHGGRISLMVGLLATAVSLTIGVVYGATSGYLGGRTDSVMMRIVDILYGLPFILIVIILSTYFSSVEFPNFITRLMRPELFLLFACIGAVEWLTMARIVRGQVLSIKRQEYIEAAVSLGLSQSRIIFRHVIPNTVGPVIIYTTLTFTAVKRLEAILSFLGLGVQPPDASWGVLIKEGADRMISDPSLLIFPSLFFAATLFSLNFLGDGLRDALDPKASKD